MLKVTDAIVSPATIGQHYLLSTVTPVKEYVNGNATDRITGYRYNIILVDKKYSEFTVKIEGPKQLDADENSCIPVVFDGLEIHVGWSNNGNVLTGSAKGIHILEEPRKVNSVK